MSINIIKEEIGRLLETIAEQNLIIQSYEKNIPLIELDIILDNLRKLYNRYYELSKIQTGEISREAAPLAVEHTPLVKAEPAPEVVKQVEEQPVSPPPVVMPAPEPEIIPEVVEVPAEPEPVKAEIAAPPVKQPEPVNPPQPKKSEDKKKATTGDLFGAAPTLADKFKDEKVFLNDSMTGSKKDQSVGARMQKNKISDLKAAIGINEKFLFINELFKGDMQRYSDSINLINSQSGREEAELILNQLIGQLSWKEESDAFQKFFELFNRRF